jgi:hypothetical protein
MISKQDLKGLRIIISLFSVLLILFTFSALYGYRVLDVFSSPEWEPEGHTTVSGTHHYFHK